MKIKIALDNSDSKSKNYTNEVQVFPIGNFKFLLNKNNFLCFDIHKYNYQSSVNDLIAKQLKGVSLLLSRKKIKNEKVLVSPEVGSQQFSIIGKRSRFMEFANEFSKRKNVEQIRFEPKKNGLSSSSAFTILLQHMNDKTVKTIFTFDSFVMHFAANFKNKNIFVAMRGKISNKELFGHFNNINPKSKNIFYFR